MGGKDLPPAGTLDIPELSMDVRTLLEMKLIRLDQMLDETPVKLISKTKIRKAAGG